jgi:hypothetical protein
MLVPGIESGQSGITSSAPPVIERRLRLILGLWLIANSLSPIV